MTGVLFTIGHSTHTIEELISILRAFEIETVADVRTIPKSRHNPQFNENNLKEELEKQGLRYIHLEKLGGLRHTTRASVNTAWENSSFRGFADYMQTAYFKTGIEELIQIAAEKRTVILCAEAVPWRCHRSLIGDALIVRGIKVEDILNEKSSKPHLLTPWAKVEGETITYPGKAQ